MLDEQDIKQIAGLLKENNKTLKEEIVSEITEVVNYAFNEFEGKINDRADKLESKMTGLESKMIEMDGKMIEMDKKIELRPTLSQIMSWGDKKIVDLELDMDRVKYLHREEFKNLPSQPEITAGLIEAGIN